jgi:anaerobic selenocysteine-containing dehydrogenase
VSWPGWLVAPSRQSGRLGAALPMIENGTFEHRLFDLADIGIVFKPQADLILLNTIANNIIKTGRVNKDFITAHRSSSVARPLSATVYAPIILCSKRRPAPRGPRRDRYEFRRLCRLCFRMHDPQCRRADRRAPRIGLKPWLNSMPTRRPRSSASGQWASTSVRAAYGRTISSTMSSVNFLVFKRFQGWALAGKRARAGARKFRATPGAR